MNGVVTKSKTLELSAVLNEISLLFQYTSLHWGLVDILTTIVVGASLDGTNTNLNPFLAFFFFFKLNFYGLYHYCIHPTMYSYDRKLHI